MTVGEFKDLACNSHYATPANKDYGELERIIWKKLFTSQPIYGSAVSGSLIPPEVEEWNCNKLGSNLDRLKEKIPGVNTPYLYFGMFKAAFPWHTEDMDLYSIITSYFIRFWQALAQV